MRWYHILAEFTAKSEGAPCCTRCARVYMSMMQSTRTRQACFIPFKFISHSMTPFPKPKTETTKPILFTLRLAVHLVLYLIRFPVSPHHALLGNLDDWSRSHCVSEHWIALPYSYSCSYNIPCFVAHYNSTSYPRVQYFIAHCVQSNFWHQNKNGSTARFPCLLHNNEYKVRPRKWEWNSLSLKLCPGYRAI